MKFMTVQTIKLPPTIKVEREEPFLNLREEDAYMSSQKSFSIRPRTILSKQQRDIDLVIQSPRADVLRRPFVISTNVATT